MDTTPDRGTVIGSVGAPTNRVDGLPKVTGQARYAAEYDAPGLLHGCVVSSTIAKGRIVSIDERAARALPGVIEIFTHEHKPRTTMLGIKYKDAVAPPGQPLRLLHDAHVLHSGQPIALVVADSFETARDAAALVRVEYEVEAHHTDLHAALGASYVPPSKRLFVLTPPEPRGDAEAAFRAAPVQVDATYHVAREYHNPMEPFATTVVWEGDGRITVYDKTQGSQNVQLYIRNVFGFRLKDIRVINAYVGGAFGSGLRPQPSVFMAVLAAKALQRSVRVELSRDDMFSTAPRPETVQHVRLGATNDGTLRALQHRAVAVTSQHEDHQEVVVNWSGILYKCDNVKLEYELTKLDIATPTDMRAPGAAIGSFAIESAVDELAHALQMDPMALRLMNYTERDDDGNKKFTSKALRDCFAQGAERFGWAARTRAPRSMREGRELVGWGMACAAWDARMAPYPTRARVTMLPDGTAEVQSSACDIGTGTYTILTQLAADALALPTSAVRTRLGDSSLPLAPPVGASWTAASAGTAVHKAAESLARELIKRARSLKGTVFSDTAASELCLANGAVQHVTRPAVRMSFQDIIAATGGEPIEHTGTAIPNVLKMRGHAGYAHSAIFVEARVDEALGVVRVTRVVNAVAAGRILNPKTARSQILGSVVMAVGQALHEEAVTDHRLGRVMNHNLAEYHIPCNADIGEIDVIFVPEDERRVSPIGVKGLGEVGIVGTAAAIANAIFHATGKRIRQLPITIDQLL